MEEDTLFAEMMAELRSEGVATEALFTELKTHFDEVKLNSRRTPGSLTFMTKQAENLIALRAAKVQIIKGVADLRHKGFGNNMKTKVLALKQEAGEDDGIPYKVIKYLIDKLRVNSDQIMDITESESVVDAVIEDEDRLLEHRLQDVPADEDEDAPIPITMDFENPELVCDEFGEFHVISGNVILDDEYDLPEISPTFDVGKHGELHAFDSEGKEVKLVRLETLVGKELIEDGETE
jgi:hypothetical protein